MRLDSSHSSVVNGGHHGSFRSRVSDGAGDMGGSVGGGVGGGGIVVRIGSSVSVGGVRGGGELGSLGNISSTSTTYSGEHPDGRWSWVIVFASFLAQVSRTFRYIRFIVYKDAIYEDSPLF